MAGCTGPALAPGRSRRPRASPGSTALPRSRLPTGSGFDVEVLPIDAGGSLFGYQAVVLGSAIRYGTWLPETIKFIASRRSGLSRSPLAIFTLHMQALGDDAANQDTRVGRRRDATRPMPEPAVKLTLADIANLPLPVRRYLHLSGAIGKAPVRSVRVAWGAEMFKAPGHKGMPGPAE